MIVCYDGRLYLKYRTLIGRARTCVIFHALTKSAVLDSVNIHRMNEHDQIFVPLNRYEKEFWEGSRKLSKETTLREYERGKSKKPPKEENIRIFYKNLRKKDLQNEKDSV